MYKENKCKVAVSTHTHNYCNVFIYAQSFHWESFSNFDPPPPFKAEKKEAFLVLAQSDSSDLMGDKVTESLSEYPTEAAVKQKGNITPCSRGGNCITER